jgi:hypothetical protein
MISRHHTRIIHNNHEVSFADAARALGCTHETLTTRLGRLRMKYGLVPFVSLQKLKRDSAVYDPRGGGSAAAYPS